MQTLVDQFVAEILTEIKTNRLKLPTLPEVAFKVREAVNDADAPAARVAKVVGSDAALAARLLQVANSPLYRANKQIDSLQSAVARLGVPVVRNLIMSLLMKQLYDTKSPALRKRMLRLWEHSAQVAAISHVLARKFTKLKADEAMLGGLVHDIGALPILVKAETYPELAADEKTLNGIVEKLHASIGRLILEAWKFPPELVAVAALHEDLQRVSPETDYVDVVLVANMHSYVGTDHRHARADWGNIPAFARLGLSPDHSIAALEEAGADMAEVRKLLAA